jgi:hypothetical protein
VGEKNRNNNVFSKKMRMQMSDITLPLLKEILREKIG